MPVYEYRCDSCGVESDVILPFSEAGKEMKCGWCGQVMRRKLSLAHFTIPETGRDKVLATLNDEKGSRKLPGGKKHSARYTASLAKGLDQKGQPGRYRSGVSATVD